MSENTQKISRIPAGIREKINQLKQLETSLGHLPPESWALSELQRRVSDPSFPFMSNQMEQQTELLFGDICEELSDLGFRPFETAEAVNAILQFQGGPKYCDENEVREALGISDDDERVR